MLVRLAFAVSVCVEPELLVVDEALSVGDVFFQQKCFKRIHAMIDKGMTLLFVSHDTPAVQNLCTRAIVLQNGHSIYQGPPEEAASRYYASAPGHDAIAPGNATDGSAGPVGGINEALKAEILANNILRHARSRHGAQDVEIIGAAFVNENGLHALMVEMLKTAQVHLLLKARKFVAQPTVGIGIFDRMNNLIFAAGTQQLRVAMVPMQPGEERLVTMKVQFAVHPASTRFNLPAVNPPPMDPTWDFTRIGMRDSGR